MSKIRRGAPRESGERLDRYLQIKTGLSRKKVKSLLDQGRVYLNNRKVIIASWQVPTGATVEVREKSEERSEATKGHFLKVVFEDSHLLVVDKPAGILCEASPLATKPTLIEIINAYFKRRHPHLKGHYLGLVHRLDRDTSGLMVYTKTREANKLTEQFRRHTIEKRYLALVSGAVDKESGEIEGFLKKNPLLKGGRKVQPSTRASGQYAVTHWRLVSGDKTEHRTDPSDPGSSGRDGTSSYWREGLWRQRGDRFLAPGVARLLSLLPSSGHRRGEGVSVEAAEGYAEPRRSFEIYGLKIRVSFPIRLVRSILITSPRWVSSKTRFASDRSRSSRVARSSSGSPAGPQRRSSDFPFEFRCPETTLQLFKSPSGAGSLPNSR
ncbi:MAG: RluA family pseudouridine synthase [Deltaproteobacteria bacterium]|nr:RluA family pseudouridine synthase [Deltaproteobacteria bacterium]